MQLENKKQPTILIITENTQFQSNQQLRDAALKLHYNVEFYNPYINVAPNSTNSPDLIINRISGIRFDSHDLAQLITHFGHIPNNIYNSIHHTLVFRDKDLQLATLRGLGLQTLPFYSVRTPQTIKHLAEQLDQAFAGTQEHNSYILKSIRGNQGLGVSGEMNTKELWATLQEHHIKGDLRYFIQPFIKYNEEIRVLVIKGKDIAIAGKRDSGPWQALDLDELPGHSRQLINDSLKHLPTLSALDLFICDTESYINEVNLVPGIVKMQNAFHERKDIALEIIKCLTQN